MVAFLAGAILTAQTLNDVFTDSNSDSQDTLGSTTATSFTATLTGGTACGVSFIAPTSGIVLIANNTFVENTGAAARAYCTIRVRTGSSIGSGSDVLAATDENSIATAGGAGDDGAFGRVFRLTGLTAGQSFNIQQLFRVSGSTGNFAWKRLSVYPVAA